jgi:hypothetical protein
MSQTAPIQRRGRVLKGVLRAFVASGSETLSTSQIMAWTHVRRLYDGRNSERERRNYRRRVRIACDRLCVRDGRARARGAPIMWRLREPIE